MFIMHMPMTFKVGDTAELVLVSSRGLRYPRINKQLKRITWRDENTLVIGEDDACEIAATYVEDGLRRFICHSAHGTQYAIAEPERKDG
jgi:hypothetical protein